MTTLTYEATKEATACAVAKCTVPTSTMLVAVAVTEEVYGVRYSNEKYVTAREWIAGRVSVTWVERALYQLAAENVCVRVPQDLLSSYNAARGTHGWMSHEAYDAHEARLAESKRTTHEASRLNAVRAQAQRNVLARHADEVATEIERLTLEAEATS